MTDGKRSISRAELLEWANDSVAFIDLDLGRISTILLAQMYASEKNRVFNTYDLTMPIKVLEGITRGDATRKEEEFRHKPLKGFYKKHFFSPWRTRRGLFAVTAHVIRKLIRPSNSGLHF